MALIKFGDWAIVQNLANNLAADINRANKISLAQVALRAEGIAVKHLRDQDLRWRKLSREYLIFKMAHGLSTKILIATSSYMQSITSKVNAEGTESYAGVFRGAKSKGGDDITSIAKLHEVGSVKRNIPARPLWKPTYGEVRKWLIQSNLFAENALREMRKRTGGKG